MEERPILFSTPMAIATVEGRKDQTRRILSPQPAQHHWQAMPGYQRRFAVMPTQQGLCARVSHHYLGREDDVQWIKCPYGVPGDRLWGKETFYAWGRWETRFDAKLRRDAWHFVDMTRESDRQYLFSEPEGHKKGIRGGVTPNWWKRPAIFMPRVASRIYREIVSVRAEQVQDISEADAIAEGLIQWSDPPRMPDTYYGLTRADVWETDPRKAYARLWDEINGKRAPWKSNPFVWAIQYKPVEE